MKKLQDHDVVAGTRVLSGKKKGREVGIRKGRDRERDKRRSKKKVWISPGGRSLGRSEVAVPTGR